MLMFVRPSDAGLRTAVGRAAGSRPGATACEPVRGPEALYTAHPRGSPAMRREIRWNHERGVRVRVRKGGFRFVSSLSRLPLQFVPATAKRLDHFDSLKY